MSYMDNKNNNNSTNRVNNKFCSKNYKSLDQLNIIRQKRQLLSTEANISKANYFRDLYIKIFSNNSLLKTNCSMRSLSALPSMRDKSIQKNFNNWYVKIF